MHPPCKLMSYVIVCYKGRNGGINHQTVLFYIEDGVESI
jgi:hypothetical protein